MSTTVGFVGLGRMGKPMALNLLGAGFHVLVLSRSRPPVEALINAGAEEAASLADMAARAEAVVRACRMSRPRKPSTSEPTASQPTPGQGRSSSSTAP